MKPNPETEIYANAGPLNAGEVRRYAKKFALAGDHTDLFVRAVQRQAEGLFNMATLPGDWKYHQAQVFKTFRQLGLLDAERIAASNLAREIVDSLPITPVNPLPTQESIVNFGAEAERIRRAKGIQRRETERIGQILKARFQRLMSPGDNELTINNSNERVKFPDDPVYQKADPGIRKKMRQRLLTEHEYYELEEKGRERQDIEKNDTLTLDIRWISHPENLVEEAQQAISHDLTIAKLSQEQQQKIFHFVQMLLSGQTVSKAEIISAGVDPKLVLRKAGNVLTNHHLNTTPTMREIKRRLRPWEKPSYTERGTDPNIFLGDNSDRHSED